MSNYELPLTIFVSLQRGSEIPGALNQQPMSYYSTISSYPCSSVPRLFPPLDDNTPLLLPLSAY